MENNATQAWLFAMTSGLASALGEDVGATMYVDPVLHMMGMPHRINVLDSHTVLSAMLAGASGAMTYTSVSVLTSESIENFSKHEGWSMLTKYPGATAAGLFILGAYLNLLLARVVSLVTPDNSPIKHVCASHPPSSTSSHHEETGRITETDWEHGHDNHSQTIQIEDAPDSCCPGHNDEHQPLLLHHQKTRAVDVAADHCSGRSGRANTFPRQSAHGHSGVQQTTSELSSEPMEHKCRCEYACTKPGCYALEHCHITPLYPHMHAHSHDLGDAESHNVLQSQVLFPAKSDLDMCHNGRGVSCRETGAGSRLHAEIDVGVETDSNKSCCSRQDTRARSCGYGVDGPPHGGEPAVQLAGPGSSSASQVSTQHHRLLIHVGLQTAVAIGLHKIPEGLIIYLSRQASPKLGVSVAASLFFHNLPEGMMLALPLFLATGRRHMAFSIAALMGAVPPAIGAALGMLALGDVGQNNAMLSEIFGIAFGITAGMMCMVALNGMLPTARIYDKSGNIVAWFFALGVALMLFANTALA